MELDQVLIALANVLDRNTQEDALLQQVRHVLLEALSGVPMPAADDDVTTLLTPWLREVRSSGLHAVAEVYQETLSRTLRRTSRGLVVERTRQAHRATGAYYTGDQVVRYMIRRARTFFPGAISVLDPACGGGAFLAGAVDEFGQQLYRIAGCDPDRTALGLCQQLVPRAQVVELDTLLGEVEGGFDLCLGNPPYISTGLRGAGSQDADRLQALRLRYPSAAQYKLNTYPLFIERGLELLREGGVLGFIVPDSFLSGRYFQGVRQLLLKHTLLELTLIRQDFWRHGRVGQSVILFVRKGAAPQGHCVSVKVCDRLDDLETKQPTELPVSALVWGSLDRFRLLSEPGLRAMVEQMEAGCAGQTFGSLLRTYSGLIGREGQQSLLRSARPDLAGPWGPLLRSGREIDRYWLAWAGEQVCLDPALIKSGGHMPFYRNPKLLMRQTADSLRAVYDDQGYYCLNNIHLLVPRGPEVDLRALLGLINSEPVNQLYRALTMESGRLYAQVDLDLFESMPVPDLTAVQRDALANLVHERESAAPAEAAPCERRLDHCVRKLYKLD